MKVEIDGFKGELSIEEGSVGKISLVFNNSPPPEAKDVLERLKKKIAELNSEELKTYPHLLTIEPFYDGLKIKKLTLRGVVAAKGGEVAKQLVKRLKRLGLKILT